MTYELMNDVNASEGIHTAFIYVNQITGGLFMNMLLFAFFIIVTVASYNLGRRDGDGDFPASFAVSGFITACLAMIFYLIPGLMNLSTVIISIVIAIIGFIWLIFSRQ